MVNLFAFDNYQVYLLNSQFFMHLMIKEIAVKNTINTKNFYKIELIRKFLILVLRDLGLNNYLLKYNNDLTQIEIIPNFGELSELNVIDKFKKHCYIFWNQYSQQKLSLNICNIDKLHAAFRNIIQNGSGKIYPYKFFEQNIKYTKINCLSRVLAKKLPSLFAGRSLKIPDNLLINFSTCPFDNPNIVYSQLVLESKSFNILANTGAYSRYHFLITPKIIANNNSIQQYQHDCSVESWDFLVNEQIIEAYKLYLDLSMILSNYSRDKVIAFLHNGTSAGQTVAHTHLHVLTIPNKKEYFCKISEDIIELNRLDPNSANMKKIDYTKRLKQEIGSILYQHKMMNRSPVTFHLNLIKNIKQNGTKKKPALSC